MLTEIIWFLLSLQKTSGGGRDSTGVPFPSRLKLDPKCHQPGTNFLPCPLPITSRPDPNIIPLLPLISFMFSPLSSSSSPKTKAHRSQDRCALVLHKRSTRSPPSSTHAVTPHVTEMQSVRRRVAALHQLRSYAGQRCCFGRVPLVAWMHVKVQARELLFDSSVASLCKHLSSCL